MTDSYNQQNINLRDASPISLATPDATLVTVQLGAITEDGGSLSVNIYGGGSQPADPSTLGYTMAARATFGRSLAGVVALSAANVAVDGIAVLFGFAVLGDICQLTITGLPTPVTHRLKVSTIQF